MNGDNRPWVFAVSFAMSVAAGIAFSRQDPLIGLPCSTILVPPIVLAIAAVWMPRWWMTPAVTAPYVLGLTVAIRSPWSAQAITLLDLVEGAGVVLVLILIFSLPAAGVWLLTQYADWGPGRRRLDGRCAQCGYLLRENVSGRCPECGEVVPTEFRSG